MSNTPTVVQPKKLPLPAKIQTAFYYWPLIIDLAVRYSCLLLWEYGYLKSFEFWGIQLIILPMLMIWWQDRRDIKLRKIFASPPEKNYILGNHPLWVSIILAATANNVARPFLDIHLQNNWLRISAEILVSSAAFIYTLGIGVGSSTGTLADPAPEIYVPYSGIDEKRRLLTRLRSEISSFSRTVDSYIIESTLLGAISFSAFVVIATTEKGDMRTARSSVLELFRILRTVGTTERKDIYLHLTHLPSEHLIFSGVALSTLICSVFFVIVLTARLRFNALFGPASFSVDMAAHFLEPRSDSLLALDYAETHLREARVEVEQIRPILTYMTWSRTFGILTFLLSLIISGLWFSAVLSIFFLVLALLMYSYPLLDSLLRDRKMKTFNFYILRRFFKG